MPEETIAVVEVRTEERNGIFYAFSKDMPELHLCSDSRGKLDLDIPCMIKALYRLNFGKNIRVAKAATPNLEPTAGVTSTSKRERFLAMPVLEAA